MIRKYILKAAVAGCLGLAFVACNDDDLDPNSIFTDDEVEVLDPASPTYQLDKFCEDSIRSKFNIEYKYKMSDMMSDMDYNLVPAKYVNSVDLAVLLKYLWLDVYYKVVPDKNFLRLYAPRIIHLVGSHAVNAANGTIKLGTAEGGIMITFYGVNAMDENDLDYMNQYFFLTMHHEFAHILHQTKTYPKTFDQLSAGNYDPLNWQGRDARVVASMGFMTPYGSSQAREDFAETIANYITMSKADSLQLFTWAKENWVQSSNTVYEAETDEDGVDGEAMLLQKINIARTWFKDAWNMDLDELRREVQRRQDTYSPQLIEQLRKQVTDIPTANDNVTTTNK